VHEVTVKLVQFFHDSAASRPGILLDDAIIDISAQGFRDLADVIAATSLPSLSGPRYPLAEVRLDTPLANPPRIFCIGLNYRDHAIESGMKIPETPVVFLKLKEAIIGPDVSVVLPINSSEVDYEAEMAVVIGVGGYRIAAADAMSHVFGYTILNDVSARDIQLSTSQWTMGKSFPSFCPIGPAITTSDAIPDPHALNISLTIDGEQLQASNTRELIFGIPALIEYLSSLTPLLPGDLISTGTPPGVGLGRSPRRWLKPGESMTIEVEGIGKLINPVIAED